MANFDDLEVVPKIRKERDNSEYKLQVEIIDHLTGRIRNGKEWIRGTPAFRGLFATHIFSGRSKEDGFFLRQLGVVAGVADILCIWRGGYGFIEVKTQSGSLSPPQKKFKGFCMSIGVNYEVARSKRDAHNILIGWGLTPAHNAIKEPDLRSETEKKAANFAFFARPESGE